MLDRVQNNRQADFTVGTWLVVPAEAGTYAFEQDWIPAYAGMTEKGNDELGHGNDGPGGVFVVPAEAGTYAFEQDWIPAYAGMTDRQRTGGTPFDRARSPLD